MTEFSLFEEIQWFHILGNVLNHFLTEKIGIACACIVSMKLQPSLYYLSIKTGNSRTVNWFNSNNAPLPAPLKLTKAWDKPEDSLKPTKTGETTLLPQLSQKGAQILHLRK